MPRAQKIAVRLPLRAMGGFAYLGLLIFIAVMAMMSASILQLGVSVQRRQADEELLFVGMQFRNALLSYAKATPKGQLDAPQNLSDLLQDPRYPSTVRHLRKIYTDPTNGSVQWGLIPSLKGPGIAGIYSLSADKPIKQSGFDESLFGFEGAASYKDWKFSTESLPATP